MCRRIAAAGGMFAALEVLSFIGSTSDNFIISQLFGASSVAGYAVVSKLFFAVFVVQFIISPLWAAFSETMARGDVGAANSMFLRFSRFCAISGIASAAGFVIMGQWLMGYG